MLFNSIEFLCFFSVISILYYIIPRAYQSIMLLFCSFAFYVSFLPSYLILLLVIILILYVGAIWIETTNKKKKSIVLTMLLIITCSFLFIYKYFNFFFSNIHSLSTALGWNYSYEALSLILPLGISFYTFKGISYLVEVSRETIKAERNFGILALYISFFPQLLAGPIDRPQDLMPQLKKGHSFSYLNASFGLKLIAWGLFKKNIIADRLDVYVELVFKTPSDYAGLTIIIAAIFFAIQIYCDFSAYSDISVGASQVLGFNCTQNFKRPFFSRSMSEFWHRWHISLSTWLQDYVYTPLAFKWRSLGVGGVSLALLFTFVLCGLWHGASWNYVVFGAMHGLALVYEFLSRKKRRKLSKKIPTALYSAVSWVTCFSYACFAFIFFKTTDLAIGIEMLKRIPYGWDSIFELQKLVSMITASNSLSNFAVIILALSLMLVVNVIQEKKGSFRKVLSTWPVYIRWSLYYGVILALILLTTGSKKQFLYFQF